MARELNRTAQVLINNRADILDSWVEGQFNDLRIRRAVMRRDDVRERSQQFLDALVTAIASGNLEDCNASEYRPVKDLLGDIATQQERQGYTPFESAASIICFKDLWVPFLQNVYREEPEQLNRETVVISKLIDTLALLTLETTVRRREEIISRQAEEILEISLPVVQVWDGVVAAPLIGTLDSERTQQFMEQLLHRIVETNSPVALVDITGVPTIDTQTAQHLIETVSAVRLLGAQVILTGMRPAIAQTLAHLAIDMSGIITRSSLAAGLRVALEILGLHVVRKNGSQ